MGDDLLPLIGMGLVLVGFAIGYFWGREDGRLVEKMEDAQRRVERLEQIVKSQATPPRRRGIVIAEKST